MNQTNRNVLQEHDTENSNRQPDGNKIEMNQHYARQIGIRSHIVGNRPVGTNDNTTRDY